MSTPRLTELIERSCDHEGQLATLTYDYKKVHNGEMFNFSEYDADTDIASPKQISITTGDNDIGLEIGIAASGGVTVNLGENMAVGTGGSANAGTAVTGYNRNRSAKHVSKTIDVAVKKDFIYGSSGNTAGTIIHYDYLPGSTQGALKVGGVGRSAIAFILRAHTMYSLVITAIADNTLLGWTLDMHEEIE